jgi:hypothetical protein
MAKRIILAFVAIAIGIFLVAFALLGIRAKNYQRPLIPIVTALSKPFPPYEDTKIISSDTGDGREISSSRNSIGGKQYTFMWSKVIQLDVTKTPEVSPWKLCDYYEKYLASCGLTYGSSSGRGFSVGFTARDQKGVTIMGDGFGYYGTHRQSQSDSGTLTMDCVILDRLDNQVIKCDPSDDKGVQGMRIAYLQMEIFEVGFTDDGGLLKTITSK